MLTLRTRQAHDALTAAHAGQDSQEWKARYKIRAGIEGTISQATHATGIRRARYLGLPKISPAIRLETLELCPWRQQVAGAVVKTGPGHVPGRGSYSP